MLITIGLKLLKTVILAGGKGTRISEESRDRPKPLVEIGGMPIIWHIMKIYSFHGIRDFVICCGYKGDMIKKYFENYNQNRSDITINLEQSGVKINSKNAESWNVTLVDTGLETMTGGRLKRIREHVKDETFCVTYGDDLKGVDIADLIRFHRLHKTLGTMTVVRHPERFGIVNLDGDMVSSMREKPLDDLWINGGYYVLEPKVLDYIKDDSTVFELEPLNSLIKEKQISAYKYNGQYQPMDTLKDKKILEDLWKSGKAYWRI